MRNPLNKRFPRELKSEAGKYIVIFLFMVLVIGFVSGFLVASGSMVTAYEQGFEKYNIEDGNFSLAYKADEKLIETLEKENVKIYENFYADKEVGDDDSTLRIYKVREDVNKICVMEGSLPENEKGIAIDRMYADNNDLEIGDVVIIDKKGYTVTGLVALSDYNALYSSQSDMMFDATKFGVAVVTDKSFDTLTKDGVNYCYSWTYLNPPANDNEAKKMSEDFLEVLGKNAMVTGYTPEYLNNAINMAGEDMGSDKDIVTVFLYIVVMIIAFIFAITTSNTIVKESNVIGTLRASGYTRGEMVRHYLAMPVLVLLLSAIIGNVLGYTLFEGIAADMYYSSFSLPTYEIIFNAEAFLLTTIVPVAIMIAINLAVLTVKLRLSPLKFIRRDLSTRKRKKAVKLNSKLSIMSRFRLRVLMQNMPNYLTIVLGIFFANVILLFGMAFPPLIENYGKSITDNMISEYQYVLNAPVETENENAEKYIAGSLNTLEGKLKSESVSMFGITDNSRYVDLDFDSDSVYISSALSEKFDVKKGDTLTLKEPYDVTEYEFKVKDVYYYPAGIAVFMSRDMYTSVFDMEADFYNGYLSDSEITDIDPVYIAAEITEEDLTKVTRQMETSMGSLMDLLSVFGVVMFMLIIYLLSKIIIEKNAQSISMTKVLGYSDKEISSLYVLSTTIVTIASILLTLPLVDFLMSKLLPAVLSSYPGWMPYYVPFSAYVKIVAVGVISYAVIAFLQYRKVKKVSLNDALKNVE